MIKIVGFRMVGLLLFAAVSKSWAVDESMPTLLRYQQAAPDTLDGWEQHSLPVGNGYFGVNIFGGVGDERLQFTDKSFFTEDGDQPENRWNRRALTNFADVRIHTPLDGEVEDYERSLDLRDAIARVTYRIGDVTFNREMFASYPDRVFAMRITASSPQQIHFTVKAELPFLNEFRSGETTVQGNRILFGGTAKPYGLLYEGQLEVLSKGGTIQPQADGIEVLDADEAWILVTLDTNYQLDESVFLEDQADRKLLNRPHPHKAVTRRLDAAARKSWDALRAAHLADYQPLFSRVELRLSDEPPDADLPTDVLLEQYKKNPGNPWLEALYFQYGRYLLIASSRAGTLPANLQGTWNAHRAAPWTGGYWANINIEMNYWPAFNTQLAETYEPFMAYFEATMKKQMEIARSLVKRDHPSALADDCGWTAGTANSPYHVSGPNNVSGFGTGPFVVQNMWEYYAFTGDTNVLRRIWPFLRASSLFTSKIVKTIPGYGDLLLCSPSWSPELMHDGVHVNMPGSTYDQSLIYEAHLHTLEAAKRLGLSDDPLLEIIREQLPRLDPIQIGTSGQIKEFRQEQAYGEFGEPDHRHISHLVGLFPGHLINDHTPEWKAAAQVALNMRGDKSTGWAMAHRLNAWARIRDAERTYTLLKNLLATGTLPNLWDTHPPFQIDGNFGGTAGIAEMLIQSHEGYIRLLPACPSAWHTGAFKGLGARGNLVLSATWKDGRVMTIDVAAGSDGLCRLKLDEPSTWKIESPPLTPDISAEHILSFPVRAGQTYRLAR